MPFSMNVITSLQQLRIARFQLACILSNCGMPALGEVMTRRFEYKLFADFSQFYRQDESAEDDPDISWTPEATDRLLAVEPGIVRVGTVRTAIVPVTVEITEGEPDDDVNAWDQVNECTIECRPVALLSRAAPTTFRMLRESRCCEARTEHGSITGIWVRGAMMGGMVMIATRWFCGAPRRSPCRS